MWSAQADHITLSFLKAVFGPSKICGRLEDCLGRPYHFNFFKACVPQVLFGPFVNTMTHLGACEVTMVAET